MRNDETVSIHSHDGHLTVMFTSIRYDPKSKRDNGGRAWFS